jgi:hypothetical protein
MSNDAPARDDLLDEFYTDEESCFNSGRLNNITDIGLSIVAVLGSLAATILVSTHIETTVVASVAAVPAACTTLQRIVDFRGRSLWYFHHSANIKALAVSLKYAATPDLEHFASLRAELEIEGDKRWSQIGPGGGATAKRAKRL